MKPGPFLVGYRQWFRNVQSWLYVFHKSFVRAGTILNACLSSCWYIITSLAYAPTIHLLTRIVCTQVMMLLVLFSRECHCRYCGALHESSNIYLVAPSSVVPVTRVSW